jgi:hypothetical protein
MTVEELQEALATLPPTARVMLLPTTDSDGEAEISAIVYQFGAVRIMFDWVEAPEE